MPETTKRCQVKMHDGKPCGRKLWGGGACIFHSLNEDKDAKLFQKQLDDIFKDESLTTYDFTHFVFPEGVIFPKKFCKSATFAGAAFKGRADFEGAAFEGVVNFVSGVFEGQAYFRDATFENDAHFEDSVFTADAYFRRATFKNACDFKEVVFRQAAKFHGDVFQGEACFFGAVFEGYADFKDTLFEHEADFLNATFTGVACFMFATFKRFASFAFVQFETESDFRRADFQDYVTFLSAIFKARANFWGTVFKTEAEFRQVVFEDAFVVNAEKHDRKGFRGECDFRLVILLKPERVEFHKVDLSNVRFLETDLRKVHFIDVDWHKKSGKDRSMVLDEISVRPYPWESETKEFDYALIAQLYRRLRANYEEDLRYSEAGDFYIGEMEMTRKAQTSIFKKLPLLFYKAISNYGESYYRPLGWIASILLISSLLFMFAGIQPVSLDPSNPMGGVIQYRLDFSSIESFLPTAEKIGDYYTSFLYSMSVFSFIRDKKYTTMNNWGHTLFVLESILSPVTLAFFLLALRRRFKR